MGRGRTGFCYRGEAKGCEGGIIKKAGSGTRGRPGFVRISMFGLCSCPESGVGDGFEIRAEFFPF
jgi:hypothetical protein